MVWRLKDVAACGIDGCKCLYLGCAAGWEADRNAIIISNVVVMLISNAVISPSCGLMSPNDAKSCDYF